MSPRDALPLRWTEILGLTPVPERLRQTAIALRGDAHVPPSKAGLSSLRLLNPRLALPLWRGRYAVPRQVVLTNLFNHTPTPIEDGWSVRRTQVKDFRGDGATYDSHNGTDLCIPVGSVYQAPASGRVVRVVSEFHRGGLKVAIDHGGGLITSAAHLARALVTEGERVERGQAAARTGYSGLDAAATFPFGIPHVHFNVWLDGVPVDPFARAWEDEPSLWRGGWPSPQDDDAVSLPPPPEDYDEDAVAAAVESCRNDEVRERLRRVDARLRGGQLVFERAYFPTRFTDHRSPYTRAHARSPRIDLPFSAARFDGIVFASAR
ncbi:MAG: M23 family metallopeptidase [Myxococcota bacterium]